MGDGVDRRDGGRRILWDRAHSPARDKRSTGRGLDSLTSSVPGLSLRQFNAGSSDTLIAG
jgi:hypothetical protein